MPIPLIRLSGVSKYFGSVPALRNIDLEVCRGRLLAVFGPNGAGKTTLVSLLALLTKPTRGKLEILDDSLGRPEDLRARIGLISHQLMLYGELSARENLLFFARLYGVRDQGRVPELLGTLGLDEVADRSVRTFSRGMKQRLTIARALLHDPPLLLLDEPFTGLDQHAYQHLVDLLKNLKDRKRTIVVMTHNLEVGRELADDVAIIALGRLVFFVRQDERKIDRFDQVYSQAISQTEPAAGKG